METTSQKHVPRRTGEGSQHQGEGQASGVPGSQSSLWLCLTALTPSAPFSLWLDLDCLKVSAFIVTTYWVVLGRETSQDASQFKRNPTFL